MNDRMKRRRTWRKTWARPLVKFAALTFALGFASDADAGKIAGTVKAEGPAIEQGRGGQGSYSSRRFRFAERVDYSELRDFVVYIEGPAPTLPKPSGEDRQAQVIQRDAMFQPPVLPVMAGTVVEWPNRDDIYHNVFSLSDAKEFDFGFYKDEGDSEAPRVLFDKPGRIDVFCAIHTQMHCVILVLENPFFALADQRGRFALPDVPPGTYQVRAWHQRLPSQVLEVVVPEKGDVEVNFTLGFKGPKK